MADGREVFRVVKSFALTYVTGEWQNWEQCLPPNTTYVC